MIAYGSRPAISPALPNQRPCLAGQVRGLPIEDDDPPRTVVRYVERNALRAGLVARAGTQRCRVRRAHYRRPLPVIPVPLAKPDSDIPLELQPMVDAIYERFRYPQNIRDTWTEMAAAQPGFSHASSAHGARRLTAGSS